MVVSTVEAVRAATHAIEKAEHVIVAAGAGMGVDSGLPDFRGTEGFWRAYPPLAKLGLSFAEIANPEWFERDPGLAWGFYGHRLMLYRRTEPHAGFSALRRCMDGKKDGGFVFTSNVDGHFQRAGFSDAAVVECHGSIHHLQCTKRCCREIWPVPDSLELNVDETTCRVEGVLPRCPHCGSLARPNILMFCDSDWLSERTDAQEAAFARWLASHDLKQCVVIELGAGTAISTVRRHSEAVQRAGATLVRINVRESDGPPGTIPIPIGALVALNQLLPALK